MKLGTLELDSAQELVFEHLSKLADNLNAKPSLVARVFSKSKSHRGLYIHGDVGRGKTMMMDAFFNAVKNIKKRRIHFHAFMQDIHSKRAHLKSDDVISDLADGIAAQAKLLCLDEMQISDIADAMIIGRLFEALEKRGVCLVTTSNATPDQLYKDGLNRHLFLPFIAKLKASLDVIELGQGRDYRLGRIAKRQTYITPISNLALDELWDELTDSAAGETVDLDILGRKLHVPKAAHGCARFSFSELCENALAAPDYLALARNFKTIFIDHVPSFKASQRNETKRFILMIDTFYDSGTQLVLSAAAKPELLCTAGQHKGEFLRTASRLQEMQSASWWKTT
jgi:cell division protein ZapE